MAVMVDERMGDLLTPTVGDRRSHPHPESSPKPPAAWRSLQPYRAGPPATALGLELGADDYLTKPFSLRELQGRVRALFRRREAAARATAAGRLELGDLVIDPASQTVVLRGEAIQLTLRSFELLDFRARHPGQVFSRHELLDRIWGAGFDGFAHTVNSHINRLRTKVERDPASPELVQTAWARGYELVAPDGRAT